MKKTIKKPRTKQVSAKKVVPKKPSLRLNRKKLAISKPIMVFAITCGIIGLILVAALGINNLVVSNQPEDKVLGVSNDNKDITCVWNSFPNGTYPYNGIISHYNNYNEDNIPIWHEFNTYITKDFSVKLMCTSIWGFTDHDVYKYDFEDTAWPDILYVKSDLSIKKSLGGSSGKGPQKGPMILYFTVTFHSKRLSKTGYTTKLVLASGAIGNGYKKNSKTVSKTGYNTVYHAF